MGSRVWQHTPRLRLGAREPCLWANPVSTPRNITTGQPPQPNVTNIHRGEHLVFLGGLCERTKDFKGGSVERRMALRIHILEEQLESNRRLR
jgi:hypothetical protein